MPKSITSLQRTKMIVLIFCAFASWMIMSSHREVYNKSMNWKYQSYELKGKKRFLFLCLEGKTKTLFLALESDLFSPESCCFIVLWQLRQARTHSFVVFWKLKTISNCCITWLYLLRTVCTKLLIREHMSVFLVK